MDNDIRYPMHVNRHQGDSVDYHEFANLFADV